MSNQALQNRNKVASDENYFASVDALQNSNAVGIVGRVYACCELALSVNKQRDI